ncbi:MAG: hypothetical protein HC808_12660 [Candidatus Competibacteraceae bacterium]|nr:hypothetical protein [Candidatus Competibacteraceae bacterium]
MKTPIDILSAGLLFLALSIPYSTTFAQNEETVRERLDPAWRQARLLLDGVLNPKQQSELNTLAYSAAVANLCEGFRLDKDRFSAGFKYLEHEDLVSMSSDETTCFERHLMFNYGVAVGLFMAEGAANQNCFL